MNNSNLLERVFNRFLEDNGVFTDREVLRHDYIPESLPHREEQIKHIGEIVAPVLRGQRCSNVFIYGKTGTGKTAVVKYVLHKMSLKAAEYGSSVKACYINCRLAGTEYRVFSSLCDALSVNIPFTGLALGEVFDRFKKGLESQKLMLVPVLDEIDALVKSRGDILLYELTRINEALRNSKTTLIGISNDLRFKEFLDPRVMSSLSEEEIVFRPYDADELQDILHERAKCAFQDEVLSDGAVRLCAALAAAEHGDARRALDLLRVAGELAERECAKNVTEDHVRRAEKRIEQDRVVETLKNLPAHSKVVLCSVFLLSKIGVRQIVTGEIYELYSELCEQLGVTPLTQRRVSGLINELDAIGLLNTQLVSLGRYGRTKRIRLSITQSLFNNVFANDGRLERLTHYSPKHLQRDSHGA
jgi:cell division control protein 6